MYNVDLVAVRNPHTILTGKPERQRLLWRPRFFKETHQLNN
jgi:hypothetical protein